MHDDLLWNKIFGGILGAWLLVLVLTFVVQPGLYDPHHLAEGERAYVINVPDETGGAVEEKKQESLATLLAQADLSRGERQFAKCTSCHTLEEGGAHGTGPNLWNVLQRGRAEADFANYSSALEAMGGSWDFESLFQFLINPSGYVSGTNMSFGGFGSKRQDAANMVAYLNTYSPDPLDLPEPEPEAPAQSDADSAGDAGETSVTGSDSAEGIDGADGAGAASGAGVSGDSPSSPEVPTPDALSPPQ